MDQLELDFAPVFKIGDRVLITHEVPDYDGNWHNSWVGEMTEIMHKRKIYTVNRVTRAGVYFIEIPRFGWPPQSLKLIDPAK